MDIKQAIHEYLFDESNFSEDQGAEWEEVLKLAPAPLAKALVSLGDEWTERVFGVTGMVEAEIVSGWDVTLAENVLFMDHSDLLELEEKALELL